MPDTTRAAAQNTFSDGLIMDFSPTVTKNSVLTNALNATLLTYNGNEMSLQQDMGNGRVETAFLPEGYIPIGSCEFGDIIYIVSYNPLENKSQIGCFPSPERNISSDEISDIKQALSKNDFQNIDESGDLTGEIKSVTVKKILYGNDYMNPGDKYIIYEEIPDTDDKNTNLEENGKKLSDYLNLSHIHNTWPKLLKVRVVSIEDSGKIVDLGSSQKWYDNDYYIANLYSDSNGTADIDSYRSLVSSAYSIFQSKVSGKLAILAELEQIDSFGCTYDVYSSREEDENGNVTMHYDIYFYTSWETSHNDVNPSGFIFTTSEWSGSGIPKIPYRVGEDNPPQIQYKDDEEKKLPLEVSDPIYSTKSIHKYSRLYALEFPPDTFIEYRDKLSYNAKIDDIIDWYKINDSHEAIANEDDYNNLRIVSKITRMQDQDSGEPFCESTEDPFYNEEEINSYYYYYNLDAIQDNQYQTKGIDGNLLEIKSVMLTDDVVNNYFHKDIPCKAIENYEVKTVEAVNIGTDDEGKEIYATVDIDNTALIWNYTVCPVMPYGVLDYLTQSGTIDFSKLGSGIINLTQWKYYTSGDVSTLSWGLEVYNEPNKGVAEVVMDFFDNQGTAASIHITDKTSYSGTFTESILLGSRFSSYKINNIDANGQQYVHCGEESADGTLYLGKDMVPTTEPDNSVNGKLYMDDSGTIYGRIVYLVKITVKYCTKNILGEFNTDNISDYRTFYRWYWTNGIFNEEYYSYNDFNNLRPQLQLDMLATFDTRGNNGTNPLQISYLSYKNPEDISYVEGSNDYQTQSLGATVYAINQTGADDEKGNISLQIVPTLSEQFNTFYIREDSFDQLGNVSLYMGNSYITKTVDSPSLIHTQRDIVTANDDSIQPILMDNYICSHDENGWDRTGYAAYNYGIMNCCVSNNLLEQLSVDRETYSSTYDEITKNQTGSETEDIYSSSTAYAAYLDAFSLNIVGSKISTDTWFYYDANNVEQSLSHYQKCNLNFKEAYDTGFKLALAGTTYSKIFAASISHNEDTKVLRPILYDENSMENLGLHPYSGHLYFDNVIVWGMGESHGNTSRWGAGWATVANSNVWYDSDTKRESTDQKGNHKKFSYQDDNFQKIVQSAFDRGKVFSTFVIGRHHSSNADITGIETDVKFTSLINDFGINNDNGDKKIYDVERQVPRFDFENFGPGSSYNSVYMIHCPCVYDENNNEITPLGDYFVGGYRRDTQSYRTQQAINGDSAKYYTLADMLGSLMVQLYVVDQNEAFDDASTLSNFTYLQDFTEYWNKDIVVETPTISESSTVRKILTILNIQMDSYCENVITNSKIEDNFDTYNIDIILAGMQRTISFQYAVSYNLNDLLYTYEQNTGNNTKIYVTRSSSTDSKWITTYSNVNDNTLYTWTGSNLNTISSGTTLKLAKYFNVVGDDIDYVTWIDSDNFSLPNSITDIMYYDDGIKFKNISDHSGKYIIQYNTQANGGHMELQDLPDYSLFGKYKPGQ